MSDDLHLRHLRHLIAVCDSGLSISTASCRLGVAQSVISRSIQALEQRFGGQLLIRRGKRLTELTPLGEVVLERGREIAAHVQDLGEVAAAARERPAHGTIRLACTHLQARYILPEVLRLLYKRYPRIKMIIHQCLPAEINELLVSSRADLGICSEQLPDEELMRSVEAYSWRRALIVRRDHPFAEARSVSLRQLAEEPTITYVHGSTGRRQYDGVFAAEGLYPNVVIAAADSDVIKRFTREGLGVGVISSVAYEPDSDRDLVVRRLPRQFGPMHARIVHRRERRPGAAYRLFIDAFRQVSSVLAKERLKLLA